MKRIVRLERLLLVLLLAAMLSPLACGDAGPEGMEPTPTPTYDTFDEQAWREPPLNYYPYVRWWWPGGAVEADELRREVALFKDAGFGGVEIQPYLVGFTPDELEGDPMIRTVGTAEFFEKVRTASEEADRLGMVFDFTLGSGWSSGGPFVTGAPEGQLLMSSLDVDGPRLYAGPLPPAEPPSYRQIVNQIVAILGPFDEDVELVAVTAARVVDNSSIPSVLDSFTDITDSAQADAISWQVPGGTWRIFAFYRNYTSHSPIGAAYPGSPNDSLVADHLDADGAQELIDGFAAPMLAALGEHPPNAVLVDSFELVGELPWTPSLLQRFEQSKGYDLTPYLSLIFRQGGESKYTTMLDDMAGIPAYPVYAAAADIGERVREDYEDVRSQAFIEGFVEPMRDWAHANDVLFRLQSHGGWADYLDVYELADIPESEGLFAGGTYDFLKMAPSAAHTAGRTYISSETFVSIHIDPEAVTLEDFYLLAGRAFSAGINRVIYHGYPYRYILEGGRRWYGYPSFHEREEDVIAAGPFAFTVFLSEDNPVWPDIPAFNDYLARLCYALSRGEHRADVAWLYGDWQVPDRVISNMGGYLPEQGESNTSLALKRAGFIYDRVSRNGLAGAGVGNGSFTVGAAEYEALLLTNLSVATPELMASIEGLADAGIPILVLGDLPQRAAGFVDHEQRDAAVEAGADRLQSKAITVADADALGDELRSAGVLPSLVPSDGGELEFAVDRRQIEAGDVLLVFNEADEERTQRLDIHIPADGVRVLDPETGELYLEAVPDTSGKLSVELTIPARRSLVLSIER